MFLCRLLFFFFNDTATTEIYTLSLHDALPISPRSARPLRRLESRFDYGFHRRRAWWSNHRNDTEKTPASRSDRTCYRRHQPVRLPPRALPLDKGHSFWL